MKDTNSDLDRILRESNDKVDALQNKELELNDQIKELERKVEEA